MTALRLTCAVVALLIVGGSAAPAQTILYVDDDASPPGDGSLSTPYTALQDAFDEVNNNTGDYEIRIAGGVYYPDVDNVDQIAGDDDGNLNTEHADGSAAESFTLTRDDVVVKGGYTSSFGSRDPEANVTVLSGDVDGNDTTTPEGIVETVGGISGTNSQHVLFLDGASVAITNSTVIDGVTITGGQAGSGNGGGMLCDGSINECSPQLENVVFIGNQAGNGGGAYITADFGVSSNPQITGARFENNQATNGGAVYNDGSGSGGTASPTFTDVVFTGNSASGSGGAIYNNGENGTASPTISRSVLTDNSTSGKGGAVYNHATAGAIVASSNPTITSTVIVENTATEGGAVSNEATTSSTVNPGDASPTLTNVTVVHNEAQDGGAIHTFTGTNGSTAGPGIENTILWGNTATGSGNQAYSTGGGSTLSIDASIVEAGDTELFGSSAFSGGSDNLDTDPRFEYAPLPAGDDGTFGTSDDGLHVVFGSPAIDAGSGSPGSNDVTGDPRVVDGTVDIGAYEGPRDQPRTIYVDASDTTPPYDGTSWATADTTLQSPGAFPGGALDYATGNDEIWVAEDVYTPSRADTSFTITGAQDGLTLYGGFQSGDSFSQRAPVQKVTVLSGDVDGDDARTGPGVTSDTTALNGPNAVHVMLVDGTGGSSVTAATEINGFTITGGQATKGGPPQNQGGGLYCDGGGAECSPTLRRLVFIGNVADNHGGALYNNGENGRASPVLRNSVFANNLARFGGGAVYNDGSGSGVSNPEITNAVFADNLAYNDGGALYNLGNFSGEASPTITNATIAGNVANRDAGGIYSRGGSGTSTPLIQNTILWGNAADGFGDQVFNDTATPTFAHSIVEGSGGSGPGWSGPGTDGGGNLDQNPAVNGTASLAGPDGTPATIDDSLNLAPGSPAFDAGTNAPFETGGVAETVTTDVTGPGTARRQDLDGDGTATVNIGAYEGVSPAAPIATTGGVTSITLTDAEVSGTVVPAGLATTVTVQFGEDTSFGTDSTLTVATGLTCFTDTTVTGPITGLDPGTTYNYRVQAANGNGTTTGGIQTFTTVPTGQVEAARDTVTAGPRLVGQPGDTTAVTFGNTGGTSITDLQVALGTGSDGTADFVLGADSGESTLGSGETRTVDVVFRPATAGPRQDTLSITGAGDTAAGVVLEGRGVGITVTSDLKPTATTPTPVQVTVTGGFVPDTPTPLFARRGGTDDYTAVSLQKQDSQNGTTVLGGQIPDSLVTERGVDYFLALTSGDATVTAPGRTVAASAEAPNSLPVSFDDLSAPITFAPEAYQMVSVPAVPDGGIKAALTEAFGSYDVAEWRLERWAPADGRYRSFPQLDSLRPGQGFWLVTKGGDRLRIGAGETTDALTARRLVLRPGWTQVGTPFNYPVPWDTVRVSSGLAPADIDGPLAYRDSSYQQASVLAPWRSYFVYNATATADTLVVPPVDTSGQKARSRRLVRSKSEPGPSGAGYTLRVTARTKSGASTATLGLRAGAKAGRDRYDIAKPPAVRPTTQLSVQGPSRKRSVPHAKSIKPTGGSGQTWTLRLHRPEQGDSPSSVRLNWSASGALPEGQARYVVDPSSETRVAPGKRFSLEKGETREFKVIVGTERYARKQSAAALTQYETALRGNYPNPFDETTTLEYTLSREREVTMQVYNVLGQRVETLVDSRTSPGLHTVTWDGTNRYGDRVGSGVYFVRMQAGSATETQKVVLVR
jgi:predicted outer membrane repeat protein